MAAAGGVLAALTEVGFFVDGGWFDRALLVSVGCDVTEGLLVTDVVTVVLAVTSTQLLLSSWSRMS